jgi:uncharacterized protein YaiL (DUF2058 family)
VSKSLQDQLLALGLAKTSVPKAPQKSTTGKANPGRRDSPEGTPGKSDRTGSSSNQRSRVHKAPGSVSNARTNPRPDPRQDDNISLEQAYRIREAEEKSAKQRARERKLEDDRRRAELNRQIRGVLDAGRLNLPDAAEARYFMHKGRIRKVHASPEQLAELNSGRLGVVYLAGGYHILSSEHTEQVRQLSPEHVPDLLSGADDDLYDEADFEADQRRADDPSAAGADSGMVAAALADSGDEPTNAA